MENYLTAMLGGHFQYIFTQICCPLADKNSNALLPFD